MPRHPVSAGSSLPEPVLIGSLLRGRFQLLDVLGWGGTATVYRAVDRHAGTVVAIKFAKSGSTGRGAAALLLREARCLRAVHHPRLARLAGMGREGRHRFLVLGLTEGDTLAALLRDAKGCGLPDTMAMRIVADLGSALGALHRSGFIHGDLKPGNVIVGPDGHATLIDLGTAQRFDGGRSGLRDHLGGTVTPAYASPGRLTGRPPDPRDDVFSLAVLTYAMLTGRHPFAGRSCLDPPRRGRMPARPSQLDAGRWACLRRGLARRATARHPDAAIFAARFRHPRLGDHIQAGATALAAALTRSPSA